MKEKSKLLEISHHLWYEFSMFLFITKELIKGYPPGVHNNAFLEAFALHIRNLIDFLYNDNPKNDDVYAGDFFGNIDDWRNKRPTITELLEKSKKRANKEVSHLTYKRIDITPEEKKWHYVKIYKDMLKSFEMFVKIVDKQLLGPDWDDFLQHPEKYKIV
jgi:hypothetical protein